MNQSNEWKDRWVRYNYLLNQRVTNKQKNKFIQSLLGDLTSVANRIQVVEIENSSHFDIRNVYIGDIKKAKTIITTYYDSPTNFFGSYPFFDTDQRKKQTLLFNILAGIIVVLLGALYTKFVAMPIIDHISGLSFMFILVVLTYLIFLMLLRKATMGFGKRKNFVRNNSSVMYLLTKAEKIKGNAVAYAFVDFGTKNGLGLKALEELANPSAKIIHLDSIGANKPLVLLNQNYVELSKDKPNKKMSRINYLIAGEMQNSKWILKSEDYNQKEVNEENIEQVNQILNRYIKER